MAVKLRLRRLGRKKKPFYRIVAADARSPRDGRFIEEIGYYNPLTDPMTVEVREDRVLYWLSQGAIPSSTVKSLLRKKGITLRFDLIKRGVPQDQIEEEMKKWEVLQIERNKRLELIRTTENKSKKIQEKDEAPKEVQPEPVVKKEVVQPKAEVEKQKEPVAEVKKQEEPAAEVKTEEHQTSDEKTESDS